MISVGYFTLAKLRKKHVKKYLSYHANTHAAAPLLLQHTCVNALIVAEHRELQLQRPNFDFGAFAVPGSKPHVEFLI